MCFNDIVKFWQEQSLKTMEDYMLMLDNFQMIFTFNSNNIEGDNLSYHTTREIFEDSPLSISGLTPKQIFEVRNQKFAFTFLIDSLLEKEPISIPFIKKLHKIMLYGSYDEVRWSKGERPGEFKIHDYGVGMTDEGTPPEFVMEDMVDLVDEINSSSGNILLIAAYLHSNFETIHPFADGNGRVGRTLLNYYLMLNNYPPMVIYNEDKITYFMALEVFDRTGELSGMVKFFEEQIIKTWSKKCSNYNL